MNDDFRTGGPIKGVFTTETMAYVGTGATKRKVKQQVSVLVEEMPDGTVVIQHLNPNFIPSGPKRTISMDKLLQSYVPEPSMYMNKVQPELRRVEQTVDKADEHREGGELFSAEFEYKNALRIDEAHIRATFGLGLTYLERGEAASADVVFQRLVTLEGAFEARHKHLFNAFGISLRKNDMHDQAMRFYMRARSLSGEDEHLLLNMARICWEREQPRRALGYVMEALDLAPDFKDGRKFKEYIERKQAKAEKDGDTARKRSKGAAKGKDKKGEEDSPPRAGLDLRGMDI